MVKLNILNMKSFLQVVNSCSGIINCVYPDGRKKDINKHYKAQEELLKLYEKNNNYLPLTLDIPNSKDYMNVIFYYVGDC